MNFYRYLGYQQKMSSVTTQSHVRLLASQYPKIKINQRKAFSVLVLVQVLILLSLSQAHANAHTTVSDIEHFRAIPLYLEDGEELSFTQFSQQDAQGYLWIAGINGLQRYDGYKIKHYPLEINRKTNIYDVDTDTYEYITIVNADGKTPKTIKRLAIDIQSGHL